MDSGLLDMGLHVMAGQGGLLISVGCYNNTAGYLDFYHCGTALKSCCSLTHPQSCCSNWSLPIVSSQVRAWLYISV